MADGVTLRQIDAYRWEIPPDAVPGMRVPGRVYADETLIAQIRQDQSLVQVANVATLPGIIGRSIAMPDIHWGYGFPIGGVAAMDAERGVVSPGGVGYDISCGVRVFSTRLGDGEIRPHLEELTERLFRSVPSGVGVSGRIRLSGSELDAVLEKGAAWAVARGLGRTGDLRRIKAGGTLPGADPERVSDRAKSRGRD